MKISAWIFPLFFSALAFPVNGWICSPNDTSVGDPPFVIAKGSATGSAILRLDTDVKRSEGTLPAGEHRGVLNGQTFKMNTTKYFPNTEAPAQGSQFTMALSATNSVFVSEAYILFPCESGTCPFGMILNEFTCRARN